MEVKAQFQNMSLGVYSVTTKLLKTWRSAHTYSYSVRDSLWTPSEVHHTSAFASKCGTSVCTLQSGCSGGHCTRQAGLRSQQRPESSASRRGIFMCTVKITLETVLIPFGKNNFSECECNCAPYHSNYIVAYLVKGIQKKKRICMLCSSLAQYLLSNTVNIPIFPYI